MYNSSGTEDSTVSELPEEVTPLSPATAIVNIGAVIAVLLGVPCVFIGLFGAVGVITGQKLVAGGCGAVWGYLAVAGAYELNRRKFGWERGRRYADYHLFGGQLAVAIGLVVSGALHETMPMLALAPACSAILQANDGHARKYPAVLHAAVLAAGLGTGAWLYEEGVTGKVWLDRFAAMP